MAVRRYATGESFDEVKSFLADLMRKGKGVLSKMGKPSPIFKGRKNEVSAVIETLLKKRMRNCILVGPAGVGKTEIVKEAIAKSKGDDVFLYFDCSALQAGCIYVGMFEERFNSLIKPIAEHNAKSDWKVCLFMDEIHVAFELGRNEHVGTVPFADLLKPYLSDGTITIIGATTENEYAKHVAKDKALLRRLPPIFINEMDEGITKEIVKDFAKGELSDDDILKILESAKSIEYLKEPDRSIEIADRVMAKRKANGRKEEGDIYAVTSLMKRNG